MAATLFVHDNAAVDYTPAVAVTGGDVIVQQDLVGVARADIAANRMGSLAIEGVFAFPKTTGAWVVGDNIYWDAANVVATRTAVGNRHLGICVKAAASGDTSGWVNLDPNAAQDVIKVAVAAGTALTASSTKTTLDSVVIPANTLKAGDVIRVRAQVVATATNSTDTLTVTLDMGGTAIATTGPVDVANGDIGYIDYDIVLRTVGASGTMVAAGSVALGVPGTVTAKPKFMASTAIDTTAALTLAVSGTWSTTDAGNSCRLDIMDVQLLSK